MQINPLAASNITEAKPAVGVITPTKAPVPAPKPAAAKPSEPKPAVNGKAPEAGKIEIADVKATGDTTAEGEPTFTLKVNGQEYKATQTQILALAQKAKGAEEAMKKTAELEKLTAGLISNLDSDAFGLLVKRHGKEKAKSMAIAMVKNLIDEENKDPKDIEIEELRAHKKETEAAQERAKKEQDDAQRRVKQGELYKTLLTDIDTALNETHLPKDKLTLTRVLNFLAAGKKSNGVSWTVREAVQAVEMEDMGHATHYAKQYMEGKLPSEKFRAIFGDDALKKLNKEQIETLKKADKIAKNEQPKAADGAAPEPLKRNPRSLSKNKGSEGISEREYRKQHGSLGGI